MKIRLSLSPSYCPSWGTWEAIRELVQNWLDARDQGFSGSITHNHKDNTLTLTNNGVVISKAQLGMLGETSKADNTEARGQWGEGMKISALVLAREGRELIVDSGEFRYTAIIDHSEEFEKDCLTWNCRHLSKSHYNGIKIVVSGISKEMWNTYKNNFLELRENKKPIEGCSYGSLITNPEDKGRIFAKGIFVNKDDKLTYGYNFKDIKLDRDRKMVEAFNLTYSAGAILVHALNNGAITYTEFMDLIQSGAKDTTHVHYHINTECAELLSQEFVRVYGENAVPAKNNDELKRVGHFGLKGVMVPQVLFDILDKTGIGMVSAMQKVASADSNPCTINELGEVESSNVREVMDLLRRSGLRIHCNVNFDMQDTSITFVDFKDEKMLASFCQGKIKLSKSILDYKKAILEAMVEEIAHEVGIDGSLSHKNQIHDIYSTIIIHGLKAF